MENPTPAPAAVAADSAVKPPQVYPEFTEELLAAVKQPADEAPATEAPADEPKEPATETPAAEAPAAEAPDENLDFKTLEKRFKDTQASLHHKSTELKKAEAKLHKAAEVILKEIEAQGVALTEAESALAYDNPAELARIYSGKLEEKKKQTLGALELDEAEAKAIDDAAKADVEKSEQELANKAFDDFRAATPDLDEIVNDAAIEQYITDADRKQFAKIQEEQGHAAMFKAAYEKLKPLVKGIEKAKKKMQEGPKEPEVKSLSGVGSADPGDAAAAITMNEAWKSGKI